MYLLMLVLFLLCALVHLWASAARRVTLRRITKPLLMPLLLAFYLLSAARPEPLAAAALLCGFVGDVALVMPGAEEKREKPHPLLMAGLGAFALGHLCYIVVFIRGVTRWPSVWTMMLAAAALCLLFIKLFLELRPHMGALMPTGTAYLLVLLTMAFFAWMSGVAGGAPLRGMGGLFFILSDYILARSILLGERRCTHLAVMSTYLTAQTLLVLSLL